MSGERFEIARAMSGTTGTEVIAWGLTQQEALDSLREIADGYEMEEERATRALSRERPDTLCVPHVDWADTDHAFWVTHDTYVTGTHERSSAYAGWLVRPDGGVSSHPAEPWRSYP